MRRVLVFGAPGTGKSRLARVLGDRLGLPVLHRDAEYWRPGWVDPAMDEWRAQIAMLAARDAWVMDGNYSGTWDLRLPRAHTVVWLDLPVPGAPKTRTRRIQASHGCAASRAARSRAKSSPAW